MFCKSPPTPQFMWSTSVFDILWFNQGLITTPSPPPLFNTTITHPLAACRTCLVLSRSCAQLVANVVLFTSVNLSGVFVRILTERTQRKVFLQARDCIEERLRLEDENEKQVSHAETPAQMHARTQADADAHTHTHAQRCLCVQTQYFVCLVYMYVCVCVCLFVFVCFMYVDRLCKMPGRLQDLKVSGAILL
jgi:hypothetical protein